MRGPRAKIRIGVRSRIVHIAMERACISIIVIVAADIRQIACIHIGIITEDCGRPARPQGILKKYPLR